MIEDIGDDDVFVAERDVKIPEGMLVQLINYFWSKRFWQSVGQVKIVKLFAKQLAPQILSRLDQSKLTSLAVRIFKLNLSLLQE